MSDYNWLQHFNLSFWQFGEENIKRIFYFERQKVDSPRGGRNFLTFWRCGGGDSGWKICRSCRPTQSSRVVSQWQVVRALLFQGKLITGNKKYNVFHAYCIVRLVNMHSLIQKVYICHSECNSHDKYWLLHKIHPWWPNMQFLLVFFALCIVQFINMHDLTWKVPMDNFL